jgi:cytochrome P450
VTDLYYDPWDFAIDADPYPVWKQMRDETPLYRNEEHGFYALSRFADVDKCSSDVTTYISSRGTTMETLRLGIQMPPGLLIFDDPPVHDAYRGVLQRLFRPRQIAELEDKIRAFCAASLDPYVGTGNFDFIRDLGVHMPMRTIGMLLGIPEADQAAIRKRVDDSLALTEDGGSSDPQAYLSGFEQLFATYVDARIDSPSDDIMSELLHAEFEDAAGTIRRLTREEMLNYIGMLAAAGNETTTRLIGWAGKLLAEHPEQLAALHADRSLIPNAIEEILRYESPSPVQGRFVTADVEHYGQVVPKGSFLLLLTGSANRDERKFVDADRFDIRRNIDRHVAFGYGVHFCLGAALARLEGRIALDEVLKRFSSWTVDTDNAVQAHTSTVRGWERLPVAAVADERWTA